MKTLNSILIGILLLTTTVFTQELTSKNLIIEGKKIVEKGFSSFNKKELLKARGLFERALSMNPDNQWALYHQLYTDYRLTIYFMNNGENDDNFDKYMEIAEKEGDYLISTYPDNAEAKALMCSLYGIKISEDWIAAPTAGPKASSLIETALELEPDNPRILLQAGISKYNTPKFFGGDKELAIKLFISAIEKFKSERDTSTIKPTWGELEAFAWLGTAYIDNEQYEEAVEILEEALTIDPNFGWIKYDLLPKAKTNLTEE